MKRDEASAVEGFDLVREMYRIAEMRKPEQPIMQMVQQNKLRALFAAYDKAMLDPSARIPTVLHAAIEALK